MERENIKRMIKGLWMGDSVKGDDLLVEFDRLTAENERLWEIRKTDVDMLTERWECINYRNAKIFELGKKIKELQSWLGKICKPSLAWAEDGGNTRDYSYLRETWNIIGEYMDSCDYLDSPKPSVKQEWLSSDDPANTHVHSDDSGVFWEGPEKDCPICKPEHYIREMDSNLVVICQPTLITKYFKEKP